MAQYGTAIYLGNTLIEQSFLGTNQVLPFYESASLSPYVTSGSVLILDASSSVSYPGTGNTWFDISGNGNNAALTNMAANYTASNGGFFDFPNNLASYMTITQSGSLNSAVSADFTFDIWITINAFAGGTSDFCGLIAKAGFATNPGFTTLINRDTNASNRGSVKFYANGTDLGGFPTKATLTLGAWFNLQIVRSGTTITAYQNTNSLGTRTSSANMNGTTNMSLGFAQSTNYPLDGKMGWVGIYNRALTTTELTKNYNYIKTRYGL